MAKIKQTEPATVILCNKCGGFIMCAIDQYMDEDDLALIVSSLAEGKIVKRTNAKGISKVFEECICKSMRQTSTVNADGKKEAISKSIDGSRPRKAILSLTNRSNK